MFRFHLIGGSMMTVAVQRATRPCGMRQCGTLGIDCRHTRSPPLSQRGHQRPLLDQRRTVRVHKQRRRFHSRQVVGTDDTRCRFHQTLCHVGLRYVAPGGAEYHDKVKRAPKSTTEISFLRGIVVRCSLRHVDVIGLSV